ncbi:hypothetical protein [Nostoc sp.]
MGVSVSTSLKPGIWRYTKLTTMPTAVRKATVAIIIGLTFHGIWKTSL